MPESVLLGCKPGEIFVTRNIAKCVASRFSLQARLLTDTPNSQVHLDDDNILSVLAYAIAALGVEHVVIAGHTCCGGAAACLSPSPMPATTPLGRWLAPLTAIAQALPEADRTPVKLVEASVRAQVEHVLKSDVVQNAWSADASVRGSAKLKGVHGWVYELEKGRVRDLEVSVWKP